jgi:hypothetical protein
MTTTADKNEEQLHEQAEIKRIGFVNWIEKVKDTVSAASQKTDRSASDRTDEALTSLSNAQPADIQTIAASQIQLLTSHYEMVLEQARKAFKAAKLALVAGALLFTLAALSMMAVAHQAIITISFVGGLLVALISGVNFYFYWRTIAQLKGFHYRFDRIQSYLLANSVCERLDGEAKTASRQELIRKIAAIHVHSPSGQAGQGDEGKEPGDAEARGWKY